MKDRTGKADPSSQFLVEEKFSSQANISALVNEHNIPLCLIIIIDQMSLSYVNIGKYIFSVKGTKNVPIKGVGDKHQITATFAVSCTRDFS